MRKLMVAAVLVAAMGLVTQSASAQARRRAARAASQEKSFSFGPQVDFATQHVGFGVGARAVYNGLGTQLKVPGLGAFASFDYFFPSSSYGPSPSIWELNVNATYDLKISGLTGVEPYVGAGLNYFHFSTGSTTILGIPIPAASGSETGLNLLGGGRFKIGEKLNAFAEARIEVRKDGAFVLTAGLLF